VISYATIDKAKADESETKKMRKELDFLRNHVSYYKGSLDVIAKFVEDILKEDSKHEDMINFLHHGLCPNHKNPKERMVLILKSSLLFHNM
jgi:hypothetical protein